MIVNVICADAGTCPLEPDSFDAVLCDPPYGLEFMNQGWDQQVPPKEIWTHIARAMKPGAHLIAFGGTRTWHRLASAIEDSGLEIRDSLAWLHAQGFPKSVNLGDGFGSALKPAHEPIVLARKRLAGTLSQNLAQHGTGALNIDACRIERPANDNDSGWSSTGSKAGANRAMSGHNYERAAKPDASARFPSNVLLDEDSAAMLDVQSGNRKSTPFKANVATGKVLPFTRRTAGGYLDSGGASRFFYTAKASRKERGTSNTHPTVKPVALTRYLATLIQPASPDARLLVPFAGSGSEVIGALQAGWTNITAIELDPSYARIAQDRISQELQAIEDFYQQSIKLLKKQHIRQKR